MKKIIFLLSTSLISLFSYSQTTLISNVQGYTLQQADKSSDSTQLIKFHAIQFTDDRIDKIYLEGEAIPKRNNIQTIDGQGKTLLPGFIDAHGHVLSYGLSLLRVDLTKTTSELDAVNRVKNYSDKNTNLTWIQGRGWNQVQWPDKQFPTAKTLDKLFPNTPVWLKRIDGHAGWANSKAMALAGINANTKSPDGGSIIRDQDGKASGVFIDNAMNLIDQVIPALTLEEQKSVLAKSMQALASFGLTSVHDAGISQLNVNAYQMLANEKKMPIRINAMLDITDDNWQTILKNGHLKSSDDFFTLNSIKISADGALGSRGAALIDDYSDKHNHKGLLLHSNDMLSTYMTTAMKAGFQVSTHAIGDNANNIVLNLYEKHISATKSQKLRHRIEHAQVLQLSDIPRFNKLNVIASMQATHATSDKNMAVDRLGKQRILGAYAWRKLLNEKAIIAAGSDFPIESPNPLFGLHASITRQDHNNLPEQGWYPKEKMTVVEAFKSFTLDAAYSGHQEKIIGSLAKGKKADFVLMSDNIFTMPEQQIWQNEILATWVNGQQVYKKH